MMAASQPPSAQSPWPNQNASGAVHTPDNDAANAVNHHQQQQGSNTDGPDAIREGKQKAKEAMTAAGINATEAPARGQLSDIPNGFAQTNGAPQLSRKRSRDGTQLPFAPNNATSESAYDESRSAHDAILLDRYIQRDLLHGAAMNDQAHRSRELVRYKEMEKDFYTQEVAQVKKQHPGSIYGYGYMGYGNGMTNSPTGSRIVYASNRGPPKGRKSKPVHFPRKDNQQQAEQHEELVPVRLDIELDKLRLRDTFTWNLHEKLISQDVFADYLIEDLKLPPESTREIKQQVLAEMQDQVTNYYPHIIVEDGPLEPGRPYQDHKDDEMRIQIKLNITIGRITLIDQFEWDINNPLNSPEEFARQMAWENALSGEFTTAIAHSIREQSQLYTKSLYLTNHPFDGRPIEDPELRDGFLSGPIHSAFRPHSTQKDYTPYMYEMSEAELERTEHSMMREHRAQKRQLNRRGGPALPDLKDRQRTVRSLIVHSVIPGAVETFETTGIPKTRRGGRSSRRNPRPDGDIDSEDLDSDEEEAESPAPSAVMNPGTTRTRNMRGAAAAAQANMRAGYGRSATPDSQLLTAPPQETRTSTRKSMLREESVLNDEDEKLVVKLKIPRPKFKSWLAEYEAKKRAAAYPLSGYASQPPPTNTALRIGTPTGGGTGTPTMTPRALPQARNTPQPNGSHSRAQSSVRQTQPQVDYDSRGGVDIDRYPGREEPTPAPPPWLEDAMQQLRQRYPNAHFDPFMKPYAVGEGGNIVKATIVPGDAAPEGTKLQYLPRIRCHDCEGKIYTAVPETVVPDFEVHLKNKKHLINVDKRLAGQTKH